MSLELATLDVVIEIHQEGVCSGCNLDLCLRCFVSHFQGVEAARRCRNCSDKVSPLVREAMYICSLGRLRLTLGNMGKMVNLLTPGFDFVRHIFGSEGF